MSLEGKIAELVTAANGLISVFSGKKNEIDKAVSAAVVAVPELRKRWYVDQVNGSDSNPGTEKLPFANIKKAVDATPVGGVAVIFLKSDCDLADLVVITGKCIQIYGMPRKKKIKVSYYDAVLADQPKRYLSGFFLDYGSQMILEGVEIVLPSGEKEDSGKTNTHYTSFIKTSGWSSSPILAVSFADCKFTIPDSFKGWLLGGPGVVSFTISSAEVEGKLQGRYVYNIAAGSKSVEQIRILTNVEIL
ncbi:hypothetical protein [Chromobacterium amazonense]|uniref:Uncharacterized protein n=1 Tax=Chromobacterium amazonense TaxID=1382803 RepID=A0ABU8V4L0_9NEIS|nr:hypothetical protein [Chromobacterium amazonense]MDQ4540538.1 hypothetical protein [Chromobacterium amazonense]